MTRLWLIALTLLALALGNHASAQDYPARTVRLVVAFPAGGPTDFVARVLAQRIAEHRFSEIGQGGAEEETGGAGETQDAKSGVNRS